MVLFGTRPNIPRAIALPRWPSKRRWHSVIYPSLDIVPPARSSSRKRNNFNAAAAKLNFIALENAKSLIGKSTSFFASISLLLTNQKRRKNFEEERHQYQYAAEENHE